MALHTAIGWTDATFNPWWGCQRVSPGCELCYAERDAVGRKGLPIWGPPKTTQRRLFAQKHWNEPRRWNARAAAAGTRLRVFPSYCDPFEDHPQLPAERERLWELIEETPSLDWQLLTKRIQNVLAMVPDRWILGGFPPNVWIGTSVEDQRRADERIPLLLQVPSAVRFLSCEPLLGPVNLRRYLRVQLGVHWAIAGGESHPARLVARPCRIEWIRSLVNQCSAAAVPMFVKQLGSRPIHPGGDYTQFGFASHVHFSGTGTGDVGVWLRDRKGADPAEWPPDLQVQQFPQAEGCVHV